jgi:DNA-binding transcriptional LysR family regulator
VRLLSDLDLFVEVANTRHFAHAAAALDIPASTLSRRIRALERELGVSLVNRSTRTFALTEAGQACYERARKLIAEAKRIREEVGRNAAELSGHIRVGLPLDLAMTIFFPVLAAFFTR